MIMPPRMPNPGEAISATWARDLVRYLRAITPIAGRGTRLDLTPNGTRIHSSGGGSGGGGSSYVDNGCFRVKSVADGILTMSACYCAVGGRVYKTGNDDAERTATLTDDCIVALDIDANTASFSSSVEVYSATSSQTAFDVFASACADNSVYRIPLYAFVYGAVVTDFRNIPTAAMYELDD